MSTAVESPPPSETASPPVGALPSPKERPGADVVIYDGQCRMCRAQVWWLHRWDPAGRLAFLSLHDPRTGEWYPNLSHEALMRQLHVVAPSGRVFRGAEAVRYVTRRVRRLWWLAPAMHVPYSLPLWDRLYQFIADRRYFINRMLPGGGEACEDGTCDLHRH